MGRGPACKTSPGWPPPALLADASPSGEVLRSTPLLPAASFTAAMAAAASAGTVVACSVSCVFSTLPSPFRTYRISGGDELTTSDDAEDAAWKCDGAGVEDSASPFHMVWPKASPPSSRLLATPGVVGALPPPCTLRTAGDGDPAAAEDDEEAAMEVPFGGG